MTPPRTPNLELALVLVSEARSQGRSPPTSACTRARPRSAAANGSSARSRSCTSTPQAASRKPPGPSMPARWPTNPYFFRPVCHSEYFECATLCTLFVGRKWMAQSPFGVKRNTSHLAGLGAGVHGGSSILGVGTVLCLVLKGNDKAKGKMWGGPNPKTRYTHMLTQLLENIRPSGVYESHLPFSLGASFAGGSNHLSHPIPRTLRFSRRCFVPGLWTARFGRSTVVSTPAI